MSSLRVIRCQKCGRRHYIGISCDQAAGKQPRHRSALPSSIVVFVLTTLAITSISLIVAAAKGPPWGVGLALAILIKFGLCQWGYDFDDGIEVEQEILPSPFDWRVKFEMFTNFWTMDRPWFRAACIGSWTAAIIMVIVLIVRGVTMK